MDRWFKPYVEWVKLVVTHIRPHLDELGAWWMAVRLGQSIFPGISEAPLVLLDAGIRLPDGRTPRQWKEESGAVMFGVGGAMTKENPEGNEIDEHGLPGIKKSTITIVAEMLGLMTEPALKGLLKYTLSNDRNGNASPWDLASILKALNASTLSTMEVARLVFRLLDAHYNRMLMSFPAWTSWMHAGLFDSHVAEWLWDYFGGKAKDTTTRPATAAQVIEFLRIGGREDISEIVKLVGRDHTKGAAGAFDVVTMFTEMVDDGADYNAQKYFVFTVLNAKAAQQRRFMSAIEEVRASAQVTWIGDRRTIERLKSPRVIHNEETAKTIADLQALGDPTDADTIEALKATMVKPAVVAADAVVMADGTDGIRPVQVVSCETDNEEVLKAMRVLFPNAQFYIKRLAASAHTVVNGPKNLMDSVAAEIRMKEHMLRAGSLAPRIPAEKLRQAGNIAEEVAWSYHQEGGQMLNGSLTCPGATPTLQTVHSLLKCIARALLFQAREDRGVRLNRTPPPRRHHSSAPADKKGHPQAPKAQGGRPAPPQIARRDNSPRGNRPRPQQQLVKSEAAPSGPGFNNPFAALEQVAPATVETPEVQTPAPAPAEPVVETRSAAAVSLELDPMLSEFVGGPVVDVAPATETEAPPVVEFVEPAPAPSPDDKPKRTTKPRVRKSPAAATKSVKPVKPDKAKTRKV